MLKTQSRKDRVERKVSQYQPPVILLSKVKVRLVRQGWLVWGQERGREHVVTADLLCAVGAGEDSREQHFPEMVLEKGSPEKL